MIEPICYTKDNCPVYVDGMLYGYTSGCSLSQNIVVSLQVVGLMPHRRITVTETIPGSGNYQRLTNPTDLVRVKVVYHYQKKHVGEVVCIPISTIQKKCTVAMVTYDLVEGSGTHYNTLAMTYPDPLDDIVVVEDEDKTTEILDARIYNMEWNR